MDIMQWKISEGQWEQSNSEYIAIQKKVGLMLLLMIRTDYKYKLNDQKCLELVTIFKIKYYIIKQGMSLEGY